jgi:hypothetical protein
MPHSLETRDAIKRLNEVAGNCPPKMRRLFMSVLLRFVAELAAEWGFWGVWRKLRPKGEGVKKS